MMEDLQELYATIDGRGHQALAAHQEEIDPYLTVYGKVEKRNGRLMMTAGDYH